MFMLLVMNVVQYAWWWFHTKYSTYSSLVYHVPAMTHDDDIQDKDPPVYPAIACLQIGPRELCDDELISIRIAYFIVYFLLPAALHSIAYSIPLLLFTRLHLHDSPLEYTGALKQKKTYPVLTSLCR